MENCETSNVMKRIALLAGSLLLLGSSAFATILPNSPDVMLCKVKADGDRPAGDVVLYISGQFEDGRTVYQSLGVNPITTFVLPDGTIDPQTPLDCRFPNA